MSESFLERYQNGELTTVWLEIGSLRESELDPVTLEDVRAVTLETIRRIKHDLELIATKLLAMGFVFGEFEEDGTGFNGDEPTLREHPIIRLENAPLLMAELSSVVGGPVPMVFRVFAEQIGDVDFRGTHPRYKTDYLLDALMVEFFAPNSDEVQHWCEYFKDDPEIQGRWDHPFAPDEFHKENVSGGSPYTILLPDDRIDPPVLTTPIDGSFIDYLRDSILTFGCFPGFADIPADLLEHLRADQIAF
jgi:hypothetical protein